MFLAGLRSFKAAASSPNIGRLVAQGMRFTDGHSSSGVCSPSRYTLLTGRWKRFAKLPAKLKIAMIVSQVPIFVDD